MIPIAILASLQDGLLLSHSRSIASYGTELSCSPSFSRSHRRCMRLEEKPSCRVDSSSEKQNPRWSPLERVICPSKAQKGEATVISMPFGGLSGD